MCWRTTFQLTRSTTWSSSCPSPCCEYLSPSWERAKPKASCSVSPLKSVIRWLRMHLKFKQNSKRYPTCISSTLTATTFFFPASCRGRPHALQDGDDLKNRRSDGIRPEEEHLHRLQSCAEDRWCVFMRCTICSSLISR